MSHSSQEREMCAPYAKGSTCPNAKRHIRVRRSIRSVFPGLIFGLVLTWIVLRLSIHSPNTFGLHFEFPILGEPTEIVLPIALLFFIVTVIRPLFLMKDARHEMRCQRLRSTTGILSLRKTEVEVPYADILGVKYTQSIGQRIFGVGDIIAWTSIAARPEVVMRGVRDPQSVVDQIGIRIQEAMEHRNQSDRNQGSAEVSAARLAAR